MNKILIADAGSTKTDWALLDVATGDSRSFTTDGMNALLASSADMAAVFSGVADTLGSDAGSIGEIFYYGAGCATPEICNKTADAIYAAIHADRIEVASDLLGAARATLQNRRGIACILGTGSNSCLYSGSQIEMNVPSLGFILGDEGSGAALGKRLVSDAFKGHLPDNVRRDFLDAFHLSLPEILDRIYRQPAPNKFLASLVPFIHDNLWNPYVYSLVLKELTSFMERNVAMYPDVHSLPVAFTGSIASHFSNILREAANSQGFSVDSVIDHPLAGLVEYHKINLS